ncbi:WD40/YVTN/BNR-like repeat-containing protein [Acidocella aquatica]|nr:YCF48-related protein [Acidocella aquatica]
MLWVRTVFSASVLLGFAARSAAAADFVDPMNAPAVHAPAPATQPLIALSRAGDHMVAVGVRGMVVTSDASGTKWLQANVPVESDLVAVQFIDANNGWACGHNGVILHSTDGGHSWVRQLDGNSARTEFEAYYNHKIAAGDAALSTYLAEIQLNFDAGPTLPWLSVWFDDAQTGYVVGSFGDLAITRDGGKTWQPWLDHIDNPNFYDLNAIRNIGGQLYIVGEQGGVYVFDPAAQKFVARPTGYDGSLFGITGTAQAVVVFGMRGNIFYSGDQGKTWNKSSSAASSSIMAGAVLADGRFVLVNVAGDILVSSDEGKTFVAQPQVQGMPLTDFAETDAHHWLLTGLGGIKDVDP